MRCDCGSKSIPAAKTSYKSPEDAIEHSRRFDALPACTQHKGPQPQRRSAVKGTSGNLGNPADLSGASVFWSISVLSLTSARDAPGLKTVLALFYSR